MKLKCKFDDRPEFKAIDIRGKEYNGPGISVNGWVGCLLSDGKRTYMRFYRNANLGSFLRLKIEDEFIDAGLLHPDPTVVVCDSDMMLKRARTSGNFYVDVSHQTLCLNNCKHDWVETETTKERVRKKCSKCDMVGSWPISPMIG